MKLYRVVLAAFAALAALPVIAQNTINFDVDTATGDGQLVTTATWSTTPAAASCRATGAPEWAGDKAGSGTQQLTLTSSVTLNLECTWPGTSIVEFSWTPATQNVDNTPYTDPHIVRIKYTFNAQLAGGPDVCSTTSGDVCVDVDDPIGARPTMRTVTGITQTGTMRARAYHRNQRGAWSDASNAVEKVFTGLVTVTESVGITVNPKPGAPGNFQGL